MLVDRRKACMTRCRGSGLMKTMQETLFDGDIHVRIACDGGGDIRYFLRRNVPTSGSMHKSEYRHPLSMSFRALIGPSGLA